MPSGVNQPTTFLENLRDSGFEVVSVLPEKAVVKFSSSFYNSPAFVGLRPDAALRTYFLTRRSATKPEVHGQIHFQLQQSRAVSLPQAPFGAPDLSAGVPEHIVLLYLQAVLSDLKTAGKTEAEIRMPATGISDPFAGVNALLEQLDFTILTSEINHHLPANAIEFEENLHRSAKRRLKKLINSGFVFAEESPAAAPEIYAFIAGCRNQKEYYLSLSAAQLQAGMQAAPQRYRFFSVRKDGELVAATIGVLSFEDVLYNYAPAHHPAYNAFSPVVLLTKGLVEWCEQKRLRVLDLGTSVLHGKPNTPLVTFKNRLGGIASEKLTWVKQL